ncbi:MAG: hypothetical protein ACTHNP_13525 [Solirubrobacterales bacterium]
MNDDQTPINARPKWRPPEAFEDLSLALREHLIWPVQDHLLGLSDRGRVAVAGGAAVLALGIGIGGYSLATSDGSPSPAASEVAAVVKRTPPAPAAPKPKPAPTLHGAPPVFKPPQGKSSLSSSKAVEREAATAAANNTGNAATDTISSSPAARAAGASASSSTVPVTADGPPAGPAAIAVAREFAEGFVVYETGGDKSTVRRAFEATAAPELTKALLRRPPRQPAGVTVPKAKVLNVVPAPSHGTVYPLSVSLLRVGVTSELRLEMEQLKNKEWRVVNVLG